MVQDDSGAVGEGTHLRRETPQSQLPQIPDLQPTSTPMRKILPCVPPSSGCFVAADAILCCCSAPSAQSYAVAAMLCCGTEHHPAIWLQQVHDAHTYRISSSSNGITIEEPVTCRNAESMFARQERQPGQAQAPGEASMQAPGVKTTGVKLTLASVLTLTPGLTLTLTYVAHLPGPGRSCSRGVRRGSLQPCPRTARCGGGILQPARHRP